MRKSRAIFLLCLFLLAPKTSGFHPSEIFIPAPDLIKLAGYPAEVHHVTTLDGYILELHRIPGPKLKYGVHKKPRKVAFLMHGLLCSSAQFLLSGAEEALAYFLADAGYDVWLGNFRGNTYSRAHIFVSPEVAPFWYFSLDEMARFDLPAQLDYILDTTNASKLQYIGHSMGITAIFATISLFPQYNQKISVIISLAASVYLAHSNGKFRQTLMASANSWRSMEALNVPEVGKRSTYRDAAVEFFCDPFSAFFHLCNQILPLIVGFNMGLTERNRLRQVLYHTPAGTSIRNMGYFGQLTQIESGIFQMFDFGREENIIKYGQSHPPRYIIEKTTVPVAMFWGVNDIVANQTDVMNLARRVPNLVLFHRVERPDYNHFDFVMAIDARKFVYEKVLEVANLYK